jgi:hypothetical protein
MIYPAPKPLSKKEMEDIQRDQQAEMDLHCLIESEKIKKDPPRLAAALEKKKKMQAELEQIAAKAPTTTPEKS